jgi:hypothetical protein
MTPTDAGGLLGVAITVIAYAGAALGRLDPRKAPSLLCNFVGASLILVSLAKDFNLSSVVMEGVWALVALVGLARLALRRRS